MTPGAIRVLLVNRQINALVKLKQALEQTGKFEVKTFGSFNAALEFLRTRSHDVAVLDFTMPRLSGVDMVLQARAIQPDIAIIASPAKPDVQSVVRDLQLSGVVDFPISARQLIPLLEHAATQTIDVIPDTSEAPVLENESDTLTIDSPDEDMGETPQETPVFSSLDSVLVNIGGFEHELGTETIDVDMSDAGYAESQSIEFILTGEFEDLKRNVQGPPLKRPKDEDADAAVDVFQKIAREEPPMPGLEENGTVGDLMAGMVDTDLQEVVDILKGAQVKSPESQPESPPEIEGEDDIGENTARLILKTALEESDSVEFSLDKLLANIQSKLPPGKEGVQPLPSWEQEEDRYSREPDFLEDGEIKAVTPPPKTLPEHKPKNPESEAPQTTDEVDEVVESPTEVPSEPLSEPPKAPVETSAIGEQESEPQPVESIAESDAVDAPVTEDDDEDRDVAQLALALTQASLELSATATLLTRDDQVLASAGDLADEDIEAIGRAIGHNWDAEPGQTRLRFINLPGTDDRYMVFARHTDDDYTLIMAFAGEMKLSLIQRQSEELLDALQSVPDVVDEDDEEVNALSQQLDTLEKEITSQMAAVPTDLFPRVDAGPLTSYAFVWLVNDPHFTLTDAVAQAIVAGLDLQLGREGWGVERLEVAEDYVYLIVGVPGERTAHDIIADLKRRAGEMAHGSDERIDPATLWSDSYLAFAPGRELAVDEIQRYINFARAR